MLVVPSKTCILNTATANRQIILDYFQIYYPAKNNLNKNGVNTSYVEWKLIEHILSIIKYYCNFAHVTYKWFLKYLKKKNSGEANREVQFPKHEDSITQSDNECP